MRFNPTITIIGAMTLIQIAPIKINPWGKILEFIKEYLIGGIELEIKGIRKDVDEINADRLRTSIITFARECESDMVHSREEWVRVVKYMKDYKYLCEFRGVKNGVIEEETKYLLGIYHDLKKAKRLK